MDFIMSIPMVNGLGCIMIIVDHFFKYVIFITTSHECSTMEAVKLFMTNIVKYWGVLLSIVSDKDTCITSKF